MLISEHFKINSTRLGSAHLNQWLSISQVVILLKTLIPVPALVMKLHNNLTFPTLKVLMHVLNGRRTRGFATIYAVVLLQV